MVVQLNTLRRTQASGGGTRPVSPLYREGWPGESPTALVINGKKSQPAHCYAHMRQLMRHLLHV